MKYHKSEIKKIIPIIIMPILLLISFLISANDNLLDKLLKNTSSTTNTVTTNLEDEGNNNKSNSIDFSKPLKITWSHCITDSELIKVMDEKGYRFSSANSIMFQ
jgi:hypothetical protein